MQLLTCDRLQGYYFAAPMSADEFLAYAVSKAANPVLSEALSVADTDEPPASVING